MPTIKNQIKINDIDYDLASLSDHAKAQINSIRFVEAELQRLQGHVAALQTARMAYIKALQEALPPLPMGDTMKLN